MAKESESDTQLSVGRPRRGWRRRLREWSSPALDLLFPPRCAACGEDFSRRADQPLLCTSCVGQLAPLAGSVCRRCGAPVTDLLKAADACPHCRKRRFRFSGVTSLGVYTGALREAILQMKHLSGEPLAIATGELLADLLLPERTEIDRVVPIPMHWLRRLGRSINAPDVVSEVIAARLNLPLSTGLLRFRRITRQQSRLAASRRRANVRNAFAVSAQHKIKDSRILLVDDILTTGATANSAAKCLLEAGAGCISVAVVARGIGMD